jgi:hypothetical protein
MRMMAWCFGIRVQSLLKANTRAGSFLTATQAHSMIKPRRNGLRRGEMPVMISRSPLEYSPDNCFRLDDQQRLLPRAENIGHGAEEESVGGPQSGSRGRASEYFQLLSEKDVLGSDLRC